MPDHEGILRYPSDVVQFREDYARHASDFVAVVSEWDEKVF